MTIHIKSGFAEYELTSEEFAEYTPSLELRGLYSELTTALTKIEEAVTSIFAPITLTARRAERLLNIEGNERPNAELFYLIATGEMEAVLKRVCDLLREFYQDEMLP